MTKNLITLCFLVIMTNINSQTFSWGLDGYLNNSGGGIFLNVDNSGIDISINGLTNDSWLNWNNNPFVITGINNDTSTNTAHNYQFQFSQTVDVEFKISEINIDTTSMCYNDLLSFSGSPTFINGQNITISGNQIYPSGPITSPWPEVTVKYIGITNFTIQHGDTNSCNPGKIHIHSIKFEGKNVGLHEKKINPTIFLTDYNIQIKDINSNVKQMTVYDLAGKTKNIPIQQNGNAYQINIFDLQKGMYILIVEDTSGKKVYFKFIR